MPTESLNDATMIEITEIITYGLNVRHELGTVIGRSVAGKKSPGNALMSVRDAHIGDGVTNTWITDPSRTVFARV